MTKNNMDATEQIRQVPKRNKKNTFQKKNIPLVIGVVCVNALLVALLLNTTRFSALSTNIFIKLNIGVLVALIVLDVLTILTLRVKRLWCYIGMSVLVVAILIASIYGTSLLSRMNTSLNKLTDTEAEVDVSTSFVVYSKSDSAVINDEDDLKGTKVGYSTGTNTAELGKEKLSNDNISVTYKEYSGYSDLFVALVNGEIDCAILPQNYTSIFDSDETLATYLEDTHSILNFTDTIASSSSSTSGSNKDMTKETFTVLLTGENEGLADSIILFTVNPVSMKVTMTSIPRDSYVPITCYNNSSSKINDAHSVSEGCMVDTVTQLTGIDIDYTIEFTFDAVIQIIDAMGGITVDNPYEFTTYFSGITYPAGKLTMDGGHALTYARERYSLPNGDFDRQVHQQLIIKALVNTIMESGSTELLVKIFEAAGDNVTTNISIDQMVEFTSYAMSKMKRYYNQDASPINVFNIQTSHLTGYASYIWNTGLQMDLWIYRLYQGSIDDTYTNITRNLNLNSAITAPTSVAWSAKDTFTIPEVSSTYYDEEMILDDGRPADSYDEETAEPTIDENIGTDENGTTDVVNPDDGTTGGEENTGEVVEPQEPTVDDGTEG